MNIRLLWHDKMQANIYTFILNAVVATMTSSRYTIVMGKKSGLYRALSLTFSSMAAGQR